MSPEQQLAGFIDKFTVEMQALIRDSRAVMRARHPSAVELVYDNYNFFVIGYGPTARTSEAVYSLAAARNGLNLCFLQRGVDLPDPAGLLRGSGKVVRSIRLPDAAELDRPEVLTLMQVADDRAKIALSSGVGPELIIKSVSAKQRPRR